MQVNKKKTKKPKAPTTFDLTFDMFLCFCVFFFFSRAGFVRKMQPQRMKYDFHFPFHLVTSQIFCTLNPKVLSLHKHPVNDCEKYLQGQVLPSVA